MPFPSTPQYEEISTKAAPKPAPEATPKPDNPTTPRRASAVKRRQNGNEAGTPIRKLSAKKAHTPTSAPARMRSRKQEPTLLGDFLLGRPSPSRLRRKSLENVKKEMKQANVLKVQKPGGVKERVKQWQKASVAVALAEDHIPATDHDPDHTVMSVDQSSADEKLRRRVKYRQTKPDKKKPLKEKEAGPTQQKYKNAPAKRVVSDDHWVKTREKTLSKNESVKRRNRVSTLPKTFFQSDGISSPLERKIQDWVERTDSQEEEYEDTDSVQTSKRSTSKSAPSIPILPVNGSKKPSKQKLSDDGIRVFASRDTSLEQKPSRDALKRSAKRSLSSHHQKNSSDHNDSEESAEEIEQRLPSPVSQSKRKPSRHLTEQAERKWTQQNPSIDSAEAPPLRKNSGDGITLKPIRKIREHTGNEINPKIRKQRELKPVLDAEDRPSRSFSYHKSIVDEETTSDTDSKNFERRPHTTDSMTQSLEDIPFGNSAFSILDLPLGAEANTLRTTSKSSKTQRTPSFRVPNVLKKVYNEGMKIVHDTVDPPTVSKNQPPSIESWLKNTTDPFLDDPVVTNPDSETLSDHQSKPKYNEDDQSEREMTQDKSERQRIPSKSKNEVFSSTEDIKQTARNLKDKARSVSRTDENAVSDKADQPSHSPVGLRRTPATRIQSTPTRSSRKVPFKEALKDAFRGESTTTLPKNTPFSFTDITAVRDVETAIPEVRISDCDRSSNPSESLSQQARNFPDTSRTDETKIEEIIRQSPPHGRRPPPTTGIHCLSTIASVDTLSMQSSINDDASQISTTTITKDTVLSESSIKHKQSKSSLRRRLTTHSDLVSVLSLPDSAPPGRAKSIKSARSVRTSRRRLEIATIDDIMREIADDESKYMRELKTLVDGVIPVLLSCVLSKSQAAIAAGLFNPYSTDTSEKAFTQPIVNMGILLEQLKNLHKQIPLQDANAFIIWAQGAHNIYSDYTRAWRLGFQDVVVNLAPASRISSVGERPVLEGVPRNEDGDVVNTDGDRVDVAFLLKRPMARIKYLLKATKGVAKHKPSNLSDKIASMYEELLEQARRRTKEEEANLEDRLANSIDPTRARNPRTMALSHNVAIDPSMQVIAKDYFLLIYNSSGGQRIECRIELYLRGDVKDTSIGDMLVCYVDDFSRYLLFPPIRKDQVSARLGKETDHLLIEIKGPLHPDETLSEWYETLNLEAEVSDTAAEWKVMLESTTSSPRRDTTQPLKSNPAGNFTNLTPGNIRTTNESHQKSFVDDIEAPIGAHRRRASRNSASVWSENRHLAEETTTSLNQSVPRAPEREPFLRDSSKIHGGKQLPQASTSSDTNDPPKPPTHSRYMNPDIESPKNLQTPPMPTRMETMNNSPRSSRPRREVQRNVRTSPTELSFIPKTQDQASRRLRSPPFNPNKGELDISTKDKLATSPNLSHPERDDVAPLPPVHRTFPSVLKKVPHLEKPISKVSHRRTSSPLKHEYQPSNASGTSTQSGSEESSCSDYDDSDDESSDEDLEGAELPIPRSNPAGVYKKSPSDTVSLYSLQNSISASSNSASQTPYHESSLRQGLTQSKKTIATISYWSDKKGRWEQLLDGPCSIIISPGLIEAYEISALHSSSNSDGIMASSRSPEADTNDEAGSENPLVAQVLTPCVPLRQSTMIDIEIKSPPTHNSKLKSGVSIRYRSLNTIACGEMYQAVHKARLENIIYKRLEAERTLAGYGSNPYERVVHRRSWLFGRRKSYRAPVRGTFTPATPYDQADSSTTTSASAPSFLNRFSRGSFNIARSSVQNYSDSEAPFPNESHYTSSLSFSTTPPRTPSIPSISHSGTQDSRWSFSGSTPVDLGSSNLKIRLYCLETSSKWNDTGAARLTVTSPPPGMRQESSLYHGIERRILVTRHCVEVDKLADHSLQGKNSDIIFDRILGGGCFSKIGRTGICVNVWEDIRGPNGEVGMVGAIGGVSGRTRKWCFQTACSYDANWIYNLVAVGR